jgi:hypothetical protein
MKADAGSLQEMELICWESNWSLGGRMRQTFGIICLALNLVSCSPEGETRSKNKCAADLFPSYNPNDLKQCVAACIKCDNGVTTTCSTSCTLKGAR